MWAKISFNEPTRKWLVKNLALGVKNYWFSYFADSTTALFFLGWGIYRHYSHPFYIALACMLGYLAWTLTEYAFHRFVYHQEKGVYGDGHRLHHENDQLLIAMPWFVTTFIMFAFWLPCAYFLHIPYFSEFQAGWLAGFVWYSLVHHAHHHWNWDSIWMRKLKAYHRVHHQTQSFNYGVTMRYWDMIFRTRFRKPNGKTRLVSKPWDNEIEKSENTAVVLNV